MSSGSSMLVERVVGSAAVLLSLAGAILYGATGNPLTSLLVLPLASWFVVGAARVARDVGTYTQGLVPQVIADSFIVWFFRMLGAAIIADVLTSLAVGRNPWRGG